MSDAQRVRDAQAGQVAAYAELARLYARRVTALCHARVGRADWADDLAQETLLRGFTHLHSLTDPERFGPWLVGIAHRVCHDFLKSRQQTQVAFSTLSEAHPDEYLPAVARQHEPELDREDERRHLLDEVLALPEVYRQTILLFYYDELSYDELARLLGVSTAAINARLTRARAMLRERLSSCRR